MAITASDVNRLRQQTGAGMMDCKNALVESNGDFDTAISDERARIAKEYELEDDGLDSLKVVFTNFSLLHSEEAIALSVEPVQTIKTFEGDRVVASVKSNQPKFL